jgi:hypothetical protein
MKRNRFIRIVLILILCISQLGCGLPAECQQFKDFFELSPENQDQRIRDYRVEAQLDIYHCAMLRPPPEIRFVSKIADEGEKAIPVMVERLKAEKDESRQRDWILIFHIMAGKGSLRGKQEVIVLLRQVVSSMKHEGMKESSRRMLEDIEKGVSG